MKLYYRLKMRGGIDGIFGFNSGLCFKNLQPPPIVATASNLRVVKVNPMMWVGLQVSAYWRC